MPAFSRRSRLSLVVGWSLLLAVVGVESPAGSAFAQEVGWKAVAVPEVWKRLPAEVDRDGKGYAWMRCLVAVPAAWAGRKCELYVEASDDAREYYVNGTRVGATGEFPPKYRSGLGQEQRFAVPAEALRNGGNNVIAIRLFQKQSRTNFNVAAPILLAGEQAIRLRGNWQLAAGAVAAEQVFADVPGPPFQELEDAAEAYRTRRRLEGDNGPLPVAAALEQFQVPDDLVLEVAVAEPHVRQPLHMKFDHRGRLWVVQYLQYPNPAGLKMLSRDKYLRTVYDRVPPAPPNHFPGADKITIHEDTDGDGAFDRHRTFVDRLSLVSSFAIGRGGVWVLNPPYLLFYPDRDGDDRPDGDPEVHLEGFGLEDSHSIANSLRWGPDGWLYGAQGSTVTGHIRRPGSEEPPVHSMGQLIWRYHPQQRRYEIFAEGGGNAFGVEIDAKGRVFSGHNGGDTRGFHYVQGGYYRKGFGKHGELSNPYTYGYFEHMKHHNVPRFTHTFVINEGHALPEPYRGKLFGVAPLLSHVVMSDFKPDRSSFQTQDLGHPVETKDPWFRPVDIRMGPDGAVYIADFYEQRIDHASHYQGRIHRESGRIYRLRGKQSADRTAVGDLAQRSGKELLELLNHPNKWYRQTAQRVLADRGDKSLRPLLAQRVRGGDAQGALEALWAYHVSGGLDERFAAETLEHAEPHVRLWTVRLLCDDNKLSPELAAQLAELAYREPEVAVRSQLAASARRLPAPQCLAILKQLWHHNEDAGDIHLPLLLWWAAEAHVADARDQVVALFAAPEAWEASMVREFLAERLMRRLAAAGSRADLLACARLLRAAPDQAAVAKLMAGFEQAFEGRALSGLPRELTDALAESGGGSLALRLRQGNPEVLREALRLLRDAKADPRQRAELIQVCGEIKLSQAIDPLLELVQDAQTAAELKSAALSALQAFTEPRIPELVLQVHNRLPAPAREVAHTLLTSRAAWAKRLLDAVDQGTLAADAIPLPVVRKILLHPEPQFAARVKRHWGTVAAVTTAEMQQLLATTREVLEAGSGNPYNGKVLFNNQCGKCHQLFNQGGKIGPDLTAYKRNDLRGMLVNIVNPSLEIREGYENYVVQTEDGRTLNGFIEDQDKQVVVLKGIDGRRQVLPREEIELMKAIPRSLMPEGLLKEFTEQETRDLFAYLRSTQPLP